MGRAPIPLSEIKAYMELLDPPCRPEELLYVIREMDIAYLEASSKK